ncbi:MAG: hypothetical protein KY459_12515 [Acidobacteria bacterium]|nr:hypothetical protein [Acidobacteriota bacterium]
MLRASRRVLARDGRIGGYTIHTPPGLSEEEEALACEYGPSQVNGSSRPDELFESAGFTVLEMADVTDSLAEACRSLAEGRAGIEAILREEEGDQRYEEDQQKKWGMVKGVEEGLLRRTLIIAVKK